MPDGRLTTFPLVSLMHRAAPTWDVAHLVFLDETGITTNLLRRYGRAPRGARVHDHAPCGRWQDQHVSRRVAGHGADRTGGLRWRDRWRELPRLHRTDPGADPAARRHRHSRQSRGPTRSPASNVPSRLPGPPSGTCHPIARTSIPSSSASRSSRPSFAPLAVAAPRRSGRSSASAWRTSALTNAATIFGTAGTRPPHGHEKRFSAACSPASMARPLRRPHSTACSVACAVAVLAVPRLPQDELSADRATRE